MHTDMNTIGHSDPSDNILIVYKYAQIPGIFTCKYV